MTQPVLSKYPSLHCHITSINAGLVNRTLWGNGVFDFVYGNCIGVTKAIKIIPVSASVPNVFPNVRKEWTQWIISSSLPFDAFGNFISKFYTITELMTALEVITLEDGVTPFFALDEETGKIVTAGDASPQNYTITLHPRMWILMGWGDIVGQLPQNNFDEDKIIWTWSGTNTDVPSTQFQLLEPNLSGEQIVHISLSDFAPANLVSSFNGSSEQASVRDTVITMNVGDTPYGGMHTTKTNTEWLEDVDYRTETNLAEGRVSILDDRFEPLYLPTNHHVSLLFKVYHGDDIRD